MRCWWSCELIQPFWRTIWNYAQRAIKLCILWSSNTITGSVSQGDHEKGKRTHICKNIYSSSFCGDQELEIEGILINQGIAKQVVVYECNGILLCYKKWWADRFQKYLESLCELMLSEISRTKRILYTVTATLCAMINCNWQLFSVI